MSASPSVSFQAEDGIRAGHVTGVQTCALPICAGVLPHNGVVDWLAGFAIPDDRCFALIRDANCRDICGCRFAPGKGEANDLTSVEPNFLRIMLNPAGARKKLAMLLLGLCVNMACAIKNYGAGAGGALIDGQHELRH